MADPNEKDDKVVVDDPAGLNTESTASPDEVRLLEPPAAAPKADEQDDDDDVVVTHDEGSDTELAAATTEEDREAIRARRRQERKDRRNKGREKLQTLDRQVRSLAEQNQQLQTQLASLLNNNVGQQMAALEGEITRAQQASEHFKNLISDGTTKGDGRVVAEATAAMVQADRRIEQLKGVKDQFARQQVAPKPLNSSLVDHAKTFMTEHKWFSTQSPDPDSRVMTALDNSLTAEGWDPTMPEYWEELRVRGAKYLPHRFSKPNGANSGNNGGKGGGDGKPKSPVAGGGDPGGSNGAKGAGYHVSAERVKAMKDAGIWDDPVRRDKMIKRYKDTDAQQARSNS